MPLHAHSLISDALPPPAPSARRDKRRPERRDIASAAPDSAPLYPSVSPSPRPHGSGFGQNPRRSGFGYTQPCQWPHAICTALLEIDANPEPHADVIKIEIVPAILVEVISSKGHE